MSKKEPKDPERLNDVPKGGSPFYPGQPVPVELFTGRKEQIDRIMTRGAGQVASGKPVAIFVQGEYGIGKSSVAKFTQYFAQKKYSLQPIYVPLGGASELSSMAEAILYATIRTRPINQPGAEKIREVLSRYIEKIELFGVSVNIKALKNDAPALTTPFGMLDFLRNFLNELEETGVKGIFLVLDEINGIAAIPQFAHFIKGLIDLNAVSSGEKPLPLLLMICGVEERRREMIRNHQPVERIFDVVEIGAMDRREIEEFFRQAFESVHMSITDDSLELLVHFSAGFPKIMHLLGDAAYWLDKDGIIDKDDALDAVFIAADEVGKKYVDQQVYRALRSESYHSIMTKIAKTNPTSMSFVRSDIASGLTEDEKNKFNNFLQRMKDLKVIKSGDVRGEWVFTSRMVRLYIWLQSIRKSS